MKILITGACGFVGSTLARAFLEDDPSREIWGLDNLSRTGSHVNREPLEKMGVKIVHGDVRAASDLEEIPAIDWIVDAAANPSVLAGVNGCGSRQLIEQNLYGTVNLLELAKKYRAGFILLSTSRVYAIEPLAKLAVEEHDGAFRPAPSPAFPAGLSPDGVSEEFSTQPPLSLYGSSKLASEILAIEYGATFNFPVWIDRCGVLAGAGQFGRPDQGIFAYWINAYLRGKPLRYIGFEGSGAQTRDCLHPRDLLSLLKMQMLSPSDSKPAVVNLGGGTSHAISLRQLSDWCAQKFGGQPVGQDLTHRRFDVPWLVLDASLAQASWNWAPTTPLSAILDEIAEHAEQHPDWLKISGVL